MNVRAKWFAAILLAIFWVGVGGLTCEGDSYAPAWWGYYGVWPTYCAESVPYYALNPPVYYSYRVARTYGYSPFAYPPGVLTPRSEAPPPVMVYNPYASAAGAKASATAPKPLRIDNPYVERPGRSAKGLDWGGRRPQVVYPAAMFSS